MSYQITSQKDLCDFGVELKYRILHFTNNILGNPAASQSGINTTALNAFCPISERFIF